MIHLDAGGRPGNGEAHFNKRNEDRCRTHHLLGGFFATGLCLVLRCHGSCCSRILPNCEKGADAYRCCYVSVLLQAMTLLLMACCLSTRCHLRVDVDRLTGLLFGAALRVLSLFWKISFVGSWSYAREWVECAPRRTVMECVGTRVINSQVV